MRFLSKVVTVAIVAGLVVIGYQYVRVQTRKPAAVVTDTPDGAVVDDWLAVAADALKQGGEAVLPAIQDLAGKAMDSQLAKDARAKALDLALSAAKTDEQKNALLIACLELAGDPSDSDLQLKALSVLGKLSLDTAEDIGRKLVAIASDEKNQQAVKKAALKALEALDVPNLQEDIRKLAEKLK